MNFKNFLINGKQPSENKSVKKALQEIKVLFVEAQQQFKLPNMENLELKALTSSDPLARGTVKFQVFYKGVAAEIGSVWPEEVALRVSKTLGLNYVPKPIKMKWYNPAYLYRYFIGKIYLAVKGLKSLLPS